MRRDRKESAYSTGPLKAEDMNPVTDHPGLAPLQPGFHERVRVRLDTGASVIYDLRGESEEDAVARAESELPNAVDISPAETVTDGE